MPNQIEVPFDFVNVRIGRNAHVEEAAGDLVAEPGDVRDPGKSKQKCRRQRTLVL